MGTNSVLDTIPPKIENIPFDAYASNPWPDGEATDG